MYVSTRICTLLDGQEVGTDAPASATTCALAHFNKHRPITGALAEFSYSGTHSRCAISVYTLQVHCGCQTECSSSTTLRSTLHPLSRDVARCSALRLFNGYYQRRRRSDSPVPLFIIPYSHMRAIYTGILRQRYFNYANTHLCAGSTT